MRKILITFNQLNESNGVARCAVAIANVLAERADLNVTLKPLYRSDKNTEKLLNPLVEVKTVFGIYFPGFAKLLSKISPRLLYKLLTGNEKYDIEVAFQYGVATYIVGAVHPASSAYRLAWMHCYDENLKYRKEYLNLDKVVCVSKCNKERLEKDLGRKGLVDFCYNPINDKEIISMGQEPINIKPNKHLQFVSVGRLNKVKGYDRLIDCIKQLKDKHIACSLWIIGPGEEYEMLNNKIIELGLNESVVLLGGQSNPHKYTSKADVFVCSSYTEGYSTACTEAILLGVPVITTPVSGAEEIIETAQCGLISKDLNTDSLYQIMETVALNPQILIEWKKTLQTTKGAFSQSSRVSKLFKILGL